MGLLSSIKNIFGKKETARTLVVVSEWDSRAKNGTSKDGKVMYTTTIDLSSLDGKFDEAFISAKASPRVIRQSKRLSNKVFLGEDKSNEV